MANISEIAPNVYRISVYYPAAHLQFNHFLVKDDEPLLFHTGLRWVHREIREAAPQADVICSQVGALVSVNDFMGREARALADGESFSTGKYRFRYCQTPHLPHGWDAGVLFEETEKTLLCSDLFHQVGDVEPITSDDIVSRSYEAMKAYQAGLLAEYVPYTPLTAQNLKKLAALQPKTLAVMHGSSFAGDCVRALNDLDTAFREIFGRLEPARPES